ncbi:MAG: hypothetical protein PVI89_16080 [Desulfobacteraceae bacterium]|jgi:hypothetical protein
MADAVIGDFHRAIAVRCSGSRLMFIKCRREIGPDPAIRLFKRDGE